MFTRDSWIAVTIIVLFCVYTFAQVVSQVCLGCLCEVNSGCNISIGCGRNYACGPFAITRDFWSDAGKPTLNNESLSDNDGKNANVVDTTMDTMKDDNNDNHLKDRFPSYGTSSRLAYVEICGAYPRCANDPYCAAAMIESYMSKFGRDCNDDGVIDCEDYGRIHRHGPNGCKTSALNSNYEDRLKLCLDIFQNQ